MSINYHTNSIKDNYMSVAEEIKNRAVECDRDPTQIKLVVVTKGHTSDDIKQVIDAGAEFIGENYVEDAVQKIQTLKDYPCSWHMIGHIQSRKARAVSQYFDYVHSLDSVKLARRLNRFAGESNRVIPVLLECNVSGEESKYGWQVSSTESQSAVLEEFAILADLPFLNIQGLMTMPPFPKHEEDSRPYFLRLRTFRDTLADQFPGIGWNELSMGMSGDYLVAVEEGATLLRIGTKIMGMRSY